MSAPEFSRKYDSSSFNRPFPLVDSSIATVRSLDSKSYLSLLPEDEIKRLNRFDNEFTTFQPEFSAALDRFITDEVTAMKGQLSGSEYRFGRRDFIQLKKIAREHAIHIYQLLCVQSSYDDLRLRQILQDSQEFPSREDILLQTSVRALPKISTQTIQTLSRLVAGVRQGKHYLDPLIDVRKFICEEGSVLEEIMKGYDQDREYPIEHTVRQAVLFLLAGLYIDSNPYSPDKLETLFNR